MRCLVTGCAGFIGSHLCERLIKEGFEVIGVDCLSDYYPAWIKLKNLENLKKEKKFKFLKNKVEELGLEKIQGNIDYVFHLAAQPGVRKSWGENFSIYTEANILATQKLLEMVKNLSLKKFVFASSSSVYGISPELPMKESSPLFPVSPYGVTKLAGEKLCFLYYKNFSLPIVSLRYFTVYGPRQRPDMAFHKFMRAILSNEQIVIYGDGNQTRDFTYIEDVIEATLQASLKGKNGEIYNIGGGNRIKLIDAIQLLEKITKKKIKFKKIEIQKGEMLHTFASIEKAKKDLNYFPKIRLEEGLRKQWDWIREIYTPDRGIKGGTNEKN